MTKIELTKKVAEMTGISQRSARAVLEAVMSPEVGEGIIVTSLKKGENVILTGFGTFYTRVRASRQARNPKSGGAVKVPKRRYPAFKASKGLKEALKK